MKRNVKNHLTEVVSIPYENLLTSNLRVVIREGAIKSYSFFIYYVRMVENRTDHSLMSLVRCPRFLCIREACVISGMCNIIMMGIPNEKFHTLLISNTFLSVCLFATLTYTPNIGMINDESIINAACSFVFVAKLIFFLNRNEIN